MGRPLARRLRRLPEVVVQGRRVPIAVDLRARLLGLAGMGREEAGSGLLIPGCHSVHTFGMRFELDVVFLDADGRSLAIRCAVPPRRIVSDRRAAAVLELPTGSGPTPLVCAKSGTEGGEFLSRLS